MFLKSSAILLLLTGPLQAEIPVKPLPPVSRSAHLIALNQIGYATAMTKRFTAPLSPDGTSFIVRLADSSDVLHRGEIRGNIGDFSNFKPLASPKDYVVWAWPALRQWLPQSFYDRCRDFCFANWQKSLAIDKWWDPAGYDEPPTGQNPMGGRLHPYKGCHAPAGLRKKIEAWAEVACRRSNNMWDFRRYDEDGHWTIPKLNDVGNWASFPGSEMFPFNPEGAFRHAEGWVNYGASWCVSLAYLQFETTGTTPSPH